MSRAAWLRVAGAWTLADPGCPSTKYVSGSTRSARWPSRRRPRSDASVHKEDTLGTHLQQVRDEVRALVRRQNLRATAPRIDVLVVLHEAAGPLTHEQVMEALREGVYDRASIWRILSDLTDASILRRMDLGDRTWRYELRDACRPVKDDHPHFLCEGCGVVSCLPALEVRSRDGAMPVALRGAEFGIRVMGRCASCVSP